MNISEIREKYGIESTELENIKYELRKLLKNAHPDNNNGECDTEHFDEIMNALDFVDREMIGGSEKNEVQVLSEALVSIIRSTNNSSELSIQKEIERRKEKLETDIEKYSSPIIGETRVSRYSTVGITAVITFLWLLPDKVLSHPFFKWITTDDAFADVHFTLIFFIIWIYMLMFTGLCWYRTFIIEKKEKEILSRIKNKSLQNRMMMDFIENLSFNGTLSFSREQFLEYILNELGEMFGSLQYRITRRKKHLYNCFSQEIIENVTDIILMNAEEHKVIKKDEKRSLIDYYSIIED